MARILILNGPNLDKVGTREPAIYGNVTLETGMGTVRAAFPDNRIDAEQLALEGELVTAIHRAEGMYDGIVLNAGGYSHTSVAIRDAIAAVRVPVIEVHLSNLLAREPFRHTSLIGGVCAGCIMGFGFDGYRLAIDHLLQRG